VISRAIEPATGTDDDKWLEVLDKIQQEDPTLRVEEDKDTGQRLLRGMGELHLRSCSSASSASSASTSAAASRRWRCARRCRGRASASRCFNRRGRRTRKLPELKARVGVRVAPGARGSGVRVRNQPGVKAGGARADARAGGAVEQGVRFRAGLRPRDGGAARGIELEVTEVELFGTASTADALSAAASRAVQRALEAAGSLVLRPIMAVDVVCPEENLGAVLGDLQARQAVIKDTEAWGDTVTITCEVALDRLLGYATDAAQPEQGARASSA